MGDRSYRTRRTWPGAFRRSCSPCSACSPCSTLVVRTGTGTGVRPGGHRGLDARRKSGDDGATTGSRSRLASRFDYYANVEASPIHVPTQWQVTYDKSSTLANVDLIGGDFGGEGSGN